MARRSSTRFPISDLATLRAFRPNATLSATDMCGKSAYCWKTVLTLRLYGGTFETSLPSSLIWPSVGCSNPAIMRRVVVLPQPDGPSIEKNSTLRDRKSTRLNSSHMSISYAVFCLKKKNTISCGASRHQAQDGCQHVDRDE